MSSEQDPTDTVPPPAKKKRTEESTCKCMAKEAAVTIGCQTNDSDLSAILADNMYTKYHSTPFQRLAQLGGFLMRQIHPRTHLPIFITEYRRLWITRGDERYPGENVNATLLYILSRVSIVCPSNYIQKGVRELEELS